MTTFSIRNALAVLPDRLVHEATVVVEHGLIASVVERGPAPPGTIDAKGAICIPGVVDTHSDGLEKELRPRPGVELPIDFALRSFEGRVRAAGVTTMFHGVGFEENDRQERSIDLAARLCEAITQRTASPDALVDHRILYRLDARDDRGFEALSRRLVSEGLLETTEPSRIPLVSFEDHTPGQGQYQDRTAFERYIRGTRGLSEHEARAAVDQLISEREALLDNREQALRWLTDQAAKGQIQLMAHDPSNDADIQQATLWNAQIAEFPTTVEAARAARSAGLRTVCGAPNALRGASHSGNVSASELVALGLCDGLASDYLPSALIGAAAVLIHERVCDPVQAFALITHGPADTVGLTDRGRLVEGSKGDLVLLRLEGRLATVRMVHRSELATEQHHENLDAVTR